MAFIKQAALEEVFHLVFHTALCKKELAPNDRSTFYGGGFSAQKGCKGWKSVLPRGENRTGSWLIHCNLWILQADDRSHIYPLSAVSDTHHRVSTTNQIYWSKHNRLLHLSQLSAHLISFTTLCLKTHTNLYHSQALPVLFSVANWHDRIWRSPDFLTTTS